MARDQGSSIRKVLSSLFSHKWIEDTSREVGFVQRSRKVDPVAFFWTVVLGFGIGDDRTFAALRRCYEAETGVTLVPSAFYYRFTGALVALFRAALAHMVENFSEPSRKLRGRLEAFSDVVLFDSTVFKLHQMLADAFPGTRTNTAPAAGKLHLAMSVLACGPRKVRVAAERVGETILMQIGPWVRGRLLMFDLGYFRYQTFACIERNGGFFISRLRASANPRLGKLLRKVRGRAVDIEGKLLLDVLPRLKRQTLDAEAEVEFKRRAYRGRRRTDRATWRVVAVLNADTKEHHVYITNVPAQMLSAEDVARTYGGRWEIELVFRQLKSQLKLADFPSAKKEVVEALILASVITLFVSRRFLMELRKTHPDIAERMPSERWTAVFVQFAVPILHAILEARRKRDHVPPDLLDIMKKEAIDPNLARKGGLLGRLEHGSDPRYDRGFHA